MHSTTDRAADSAKANCSIWMCGGNQSSRKICRGLSPVASWRSLRLAEMSKNPVFVAHDHVPPAIAIQVRSGQLRAHAGIVVKQVRNNGSRSAGFADAYALRLLAVT